MKFYENGLIFDTTKSRLLSDSGWKSDYDMDGYIGEYRQRLFVSPNNKFFIVNNFKTAKSTFMYLFFGCKTNKFENEREFCRQVDLDEACIIMSEVHSENSRIKFENEFLKHT